MSEKTVELDDEAYERLQAQKRDGESFSDTVKRLAGEPREDADGKWRQGLGKYSGEEANAFEEKVRASRERTNHGLGHRQREASATLTDGNENADE